MTEDQLAGLTELIESLPENGRFVSRVEDGTIAGFNEIPEDACIVSGTAMREVLRQCHAIGERMRMLTCSRRLWGLALSGILP